MKTEKNTVFDRERPDKEPPTRRTQSKDSFFITLMKFIQELNADSITFSFTDQQDLRVDVIKRINERNIIESYSLILSSRLILDTIVPIDSVLFDQIKMHSINKAKFTLLDRADLYDKSRPEIYDQTRNRLKIIFDSGMSEITPGNFGYKGVTSGLFIEMIWNFSHYDFNQYMDWAKKEYDKNKN